MSTTVPEPEQTSHAAGSTDPGTIECQNCHAVLITRGLTPGQQIRCSSCGLFSRFGQVEKIATDRLAWRSFWLGLSSLVLLFITGIPAVYYGVRSLMRMRFVRPKTSDRVAAVVGTSLGGCFGLLFGSFITVVALIIAITIWTVEKIDQPDAVEQRVAQLMEADFPADVRGVRGRVILRSQQIFDFADNEDADERTFSLRLIHHDTAISVNRGTIQMQLREYRRPERGKLNSDRSRNLEWTVGGEPAEVVSQVFIDDDPETGKATEFRQYYCLIGHQASFFGFSLTVNASAREMTDDDVRAFFESIRFVEP